VEGRPFFVERVGYPFFSQGERKHLELVQFCALLGFRRLKNRSNEPFESSLSCFRPVLDTLNDFSQFS
jgi:hypothetical protein